MGYAVVGDDHSHTAMTGYERHEQESVYTQNAGEFGVYLGVVEGVFYENRLPAVQRLDKDMGSVAERYGELFQDIVELGPFRGELVHAEALCQGLQVQVLVG